MFDKLSFWIQSGDTKTKKIIVIILILIISLGLFWGLILLNNSGERADSNQQTSSSSVITEVSEQLFTQAPQLSQVSNQNLLLPQRVFFDIQNRPVYIDTELKLVIGDQKIQRSPEFILKNIQTTGQNLILNEDSKSTIFFANNQQFLELSPEFKYITPDGLGGFFSASNQDNIIKIKTSSSLSSITNSQDYAQFTPSMSFNAFELRRIEDQIYVFIYSQIDRKGDAEIWLIEENNAVNVLSLKNVDSWKYDQTGVLVTSQIGTTQSNTILLTSSSNGLNTTNLDVKEKLTGQNILGAIVAQRCTLRTNNIIYCLIKESSSDFNLAKDKDVLVQIDLASKTIDLPNRDLIFAGETIYFSPDGIMYIVTQDQKKLYRFNLPT
jgi:hypothetical protein